MASGGLSRPDRGRIGRIWRHHLWRTGGARAGRRGVAGGQGAGAGGVHRPERPRRAHGPVRQRGDRPAVRAAELSARPTKRAAPAAGAHRALGGDRRRRHDGAGRGRARGGPDIDAALSRPPAWILAYREAEKRQEVDVDIALLLFTSGTTGEPKVAVLRHRHLASYVTSTVEFMHAEEDETALVSVPPYHIAGIAGILTAVYSGRRTVYLPAFTPEAWVDAAAAENVTHAMLVPTMLGRVLGVTSSSSPRSMEKLARPAGALLWRRADAAAGDREGHRCS